MRAPWSRRTQEPSVSVAVERGSSGRKLKWSWRALLPSRREAAPAHGPWLQLARDYLLAQGAHLHAEEASHIVADLPEGAQVAYTDAPDLLRDDALLLVPGSAMATQIV